MELFSLLLEEFSTLSHVSGWEEIQSVFRRAALAKPKHWLLPLRTCKAVGGDERQAFSAVLATACGHISIILVDDMLDADPRGVHSKAGEPATANMASALQSAAIHALAGGDMPAASTVRAMEAVNAMFLATALGQYLDVTTKVENEEMYWKVARAKSSPFFSTAFEIGALAGGASQEAAARIRELGIVYGEMIQIHDDLDDSLAIPVKPDWNMGRVSLPILFAQVVDHPARVRFEELRPYVCEQLSALEEAQQILIECGAVGYCVHQLLERYDHACELVSALPLEQREGMKIIFEDVTQPVFCLLEEVGKAP